MTTKDELAQMHKDIASLGKLIQIYEEDRRKFEESVRESLNKFNLPQCTRAYTDITTTIDDGNSIQLDSYKSLPEFSGNKNEYRSWREQVVQRMTMISNFKTHPKYEAALGIIRAKITKSASDILINNNTAYNIDAIIERLDFSFADQRPLYVVEAEMTSIKQSNKSLQEYYDKINQGLNTVITKIVMTYKIEAEQKSLIEETKRKSIRTFIMGLKNPMLRNILYGHTPKSLSEAFAIAQTVFYDNQYLQLDQNRDMQRLQSQLQNQNFFAKNNSNPNHHAQQKNVFKPEAEPMEIDNSNRFRSTNWRQQNQHAPAVKREFESGRTQPQQKMQRINKLLESGGELPDLYDDEREIAENQDDLISVTSEASAFLDE